jgi:predicted MFS family arabinose efflux permease
LFKSSFKGITSSRSLSHILGAGQVCSWGSLYYSFPLIAAAMGPDLGWSKSEIFMGATLSMLTTALFTYPVGVAMDRGFGRWTMSLASAMAAIMLLVWSQVHGLFVFYALSIVLGVLQACTLYEAAFAVISRRVGATHSRTSITTITLWGGFASTAFIPLEQYLIEQITWRQSLWVLGLINLMWACIYFVCIKPEHDEQHHSNAAAQEDIKIRDQMAVKAALKNSVFWCLLTALTLYSIMFTVFIFHAYPILQEKGLSADEVVKILMVLGPMQFVGRVLIAYVANNAPMRWVGSVMACFFPFVFAALALLSTHNVIWYAALIALYGLSNGIFTIVRGLVVPEMLTRHAYGAINGLLTIPTMLARALGPAAAAAIWMIQKSYEPVLIVVCFTSILFALAFWSASWLSRSKTAVQR